MAAEIVDGIGEPIPTHVVVQAGVGGLAAVVAGTVRRALGDDPTVVVVEPVGSRPLMQSIRAGRPLRADGPASLMGRLDCKEPSLMALGALASSAGLFGAVDDDLAAQAAVALSAWDSPRPLSGRQAS